MRVEADDEPVRQLQLFESRPATHVLLVGASTNVSEMIRRRLNRVSDHDYQVRDAAPGVATEQAETGVFDVVLVAMDSAPELRSAVLRSLGALAGEVPVIVIQSDFERGDVDVVITGAQDVLSLNEISAARLDQSICAAIARKRTETQAIAEALRDPVTGLGSRTWMTRRVDRAIRQMRPDRPGWQVAVLFADLDRFKQINDRYGHAKGDELLRTVAERIQSKVRPMDAIARFGGDEFVIVIEGHRVEGLAHRIGLRILGALGEPFSIEGNLVRVRGSVGLALAQPQETADALLERADLALYQAKRRGRNRMIAYDDELEAQVAQFSARAERFVDAVNAEALTLDRRLCIDLDTGEGIGEFIGATWECGDTTVDVEGVRVLADEVGLGPRLGRWLLRKAFEEHVEGPFAHHPLRIMIELPRGVVDQHDIVDLVDMLCRTHEVEPESVCLVIDQDDLSPAEIVAPNLSALSERGISICVDGFSLERAAMSAFTSELADYVRLAPQLTADIARDPQRQGVVAGLVAIGRAVGQSVIAAGISTTAERDVLRSLGCDSAEMLRPTERVIDLADEVRTSGQSRSGRPFAL